MRPKKFKTQSFNHHYCKSQSTVSDCVIKTINALDKMHILTEAKVILT